MDYLLTRPNLNKTAKLIAKRFNLRKLYEPLPNPPTIRWGNSTRPYQNDTKYNYPEVISMASNKLRLSSLLVERGIDHVEMKRGMPNNYPVLVRTVLQGSRGAGIVLCKNQQEFTPYQRYYWTKWHSFEKEFGAHVLGGKIVKLFRKDRIDSLPEEEFPIRNMEKGYHFYKVNHENSFKKLHEYVLQLYEGIGIEMGRFDIGFDRELKKYLLIEINTAPGLSENEDTLQLYVNFLKENL